MHRVASVKSSVLRYMPYCSVCKLQNESEDVCISHNSAQWSKCPYHDRFPAGPDKKVISLPQRDEDADSALLAALPFDSASVGSLAAAGIVTGDGYDEKTAPSDLVKALYKGRITKRQCKLHLTVAATEANTAQGRATIQATLDAVDKFDGLDDAPTAPDTAGGRAIISNMQKHGKLVGSLMSAHHRIALELHLKLSSVGNGTKTVYQLETGEKVVPYTSNEDICEVDMLHMVLVDWCYIVVVCGYLTIAEAREVHRFASRELFLDPESCKCVYRATVELLKQHDADPSKCLTDIYTSKRDATLVEVKRIAGYTGECVPCGNDTQDKVKPEQRSTGQTIQGFKPGDKSLVVPWPRRNVCWPWTNGKPCTKHGKDGKCVHEAWHGVCGKPYYEGSQKRSCKGNHKAVDCPDH